MFFAVFQLKQKQEYQLKAKHFIPPQVRMIKVEYIYCTLIYLKTVVQEIMYIQMYFYCTIPSNLYFVMVVFCFLVLKLPGSVSEEIKNNMFITCTSNLSINISQ